MCGMWRKKVLEMFCKYCGKTIKSLGQPCSYCGRKPEKLQDTNGYFGVLQTIKNKTDEPVIYRNDKENVFENEMEAMRMEQKYFAKWITRLFFGVSALMIILIGLLVAFIVSEFIIHNHIKKIEAQINQNNAVRQEEYGEK